MSEDGVIGERPNGGALDRASFGEEGVVGQDKEDWGEGAALLDPALNRDKGSNPAREEGPDSDISHQAANNVYNPGGHAYLEKYQEEVIVVDTVKGLGCVNEEVVMLSLAVEVGIVVISELEYVVPPQPSPNEPFLTGVRNVVDSRHDRVGDKPRHDPIGGIVDSDGAGSVDSGGAVLWEDTEVPEVKVFWGGDARR